jgi:dTDP-glucose 4,6-dehydratase
MAGKTKSPRTLVTGGAGFIGSHLCERLIAESHQVICIDNLITGRLENLSAVAKDENFSFIKADITTGIEVDGPLDYVLHLASPASPADFASLSIQILKVGALGTHNVLGIAKAKGAVMLLASTSEVYGNPLVHPQTEEYWGNVNPIGVRGAYDEAKRFAEAITMAYHRIHSVEVRIARIFNTYGPRMRQEDGRVIPSFMKKAILGEPLTVYGDGNQTRSFCYVGDMVEGLLRLLKSDYAMPVNLGNPQEMTIKELGETICGLLGRKAEFGYQPALDDDPLRRQPDITKARRILGWEPKISLKTGLEETIKDFRSRI